MCSRELGIERAAVASNNVLPWRRSAAGQTGRGEIGGGPVTRVAAQTSPSALIPGWFPDDRGLQVASTLTRRRRRRWLSPRRDRFPPPRMFPAMAVQSCLPSELSCSRASAPYHLADCRAPRPCLDIDYLRSCSVSQTYVNHALLAHFKFPVHRKGSQVR